MVLCPSTVRLYVCGSFLFDLVILVTMDGGPTTPTRADYLGLHGHNTPSTPKQTLALLREKSMVERAFLEKNLVTPKTWHTVLPSYDINTCQRSFASRFDLGASSISTPELGLIAKASAYFTPESTTASVTGKKYASAKLRPSTPTFDSVRTTGDQVQSQSWENANHSWEQSSNSWERTNNSWEQSNSWGQSNHTWDTIKTPTCEQTPVWDQTRTWEDPSWKDASWENPSWKPAPSLKELVNFAQCLLTPKLTPLNIETVPTEQSPSKKSLAPQILTFTEELSASPNFTAFNRLKTPQTTSTPKTPIPVKKKTPLSKSKTRRICTSNFLFQQATEGKVHNYFGSTPNLGGLQPAAPITEKRDIFSFASENGAICTDPVTPKAQMISDDLVSLWYGKSHSNYTSDDESDSDVISAELAENPFHLEALRVAAKSTSPLYESQANSLGGALDDFSLEKPINYDTHMELVNGRTGDKRVVKLTSQHMRIKPKKLDFVHI